MNDNKKIAFNTLILYAKLIITIVISFMVSRYVYKLCEKAILNRCISFYKAVGYLPYYKIEDALRKFKL